METHKEVADLICDICSKAFKHKKTLSRHMRIHSDPRYKFEVCGRQFVEKDVLKTHSLLHTTGPKRFKCGVCAKDFHHKISLKEHIGRHHKEADQTELLIDTWKKDSKRMGKVTENKSDKESDDSWMKVEKKMVSKRKVWFHLLLLPRLLVLLFMTHNLLQPIPCETTQFTTEINTGKALFKIP